MHSQQFQEDEPLRSQRLTEEEAKAVIDLWQQECVESGGLTTRPTVSDVAEGLGIGVEDVQRLLQQIRARRAAEEQRLVQIRYELELEKIRLAEVQKQRAELQREREKLQKRQWEESEAARPTPQYFRPTQPLPFAGGISPPSAEEWMEAAQRETHLKGEGRRYSEYLLTFIAAIMILSHLLTWFFR